MAEADKSAGEPAAPREVETDAPSEQASAVRPTPVGADRGWWDETAAAIKLPPLPLPPGSPPGTAPPTVSSLQLTLPGASGGRTPVDAGTYPPRPIPTVDPRPITAADLEDEARPAFIARLLSTRPTSAWLSVGMVAVGLAFVIGLVLGRGKSPAVVDASVPVGSVAKPGAQTTPNAVDARNAVNTPKPANALPGATPPIASPPGALSVNTSPLTPAPAAPASVDAPVTAVAASPDAAKSAPKPALEPFNAKAARTNLSVAVARAQRCREPTAPAGSVSAVVTFVASGRVADVTVITPTYAGTRTGKCIISKLKTAQVPPFAGEPETMKKTFTLR